MSKIMELADAYAEYRDHSEYVHSRATLKAEVERMEAAHQQELAQVKADLKSCQAKNREMLAEIAALRDSNAAKADRIDRLGEMVEKLREELEHAKGEGFLKRLGNVTKPLIAERDTLRLMLVAAERENQELHAMIEARSKQ